MEDRDMKESEVKRALERVAGFYNDVLVIIDSRCNIPTEHLQKYADNADAAFIAFKALCDYAIDDGGVDITDELTQFHDLFQDITFGTNGFIPDSQEVEEGERLHPERADSEHELRHHLFCTLSFRATDIMLEVRRLWEWMEAMQNKDGSQDKASTVIIDEETEKELKALFQDTTQAQKQAQRFVNALKKLAKDKASSRMYAKASAYTHREISPNIIFAYQKWAGFWEVMQKILNIDAPSYSNKREVLADEWEKKDNK